MSRRFMVTKPTPCCNSKKSIGLVLEHIESRTCDSTCSACGSYLNEEQRHLSNNGWYPESRIVWLPDKDDVISHDTIQEIQDKLKV